MKKLLLIWLFPAYLFAQPSEVMPIKSLPVGLDLPFFADKEQAKVRVSEYQTAIDNIDENLDNCIQQCESLTLQKQQYTKALKDHSTKNGLPLFSILGGPGYMPETGLMLAAGALYSFSTNREQQALQRSSFTLVAITNELEDGVGLGLRSKQNLFFDDNATRYIGNLTMGKQNEYYWGIGYDAGKAQESSNDLLFEYNFINYEGNLTFENRYGFYIGPALRIKYYQPDQDSLPQTAIDDPNFQAFKDKPLSLGLGVVLEKDTRDFSVNAWSGQFLSFEYIAHSKKIGSDNDYQKIALDYRYYYSFAAGQVLAFYNAFQWSEGDTPYYDMPTLGGQDSLRGVYKGHYRDNNTIENSVEYRHTFKNSSGELTKHGMTIFTGIGSVADSPNQLYENIIHSYGVGYRYEVQPRMNVRVDYGRNSTESGFYLTFNEAF
ncbi:BamA/TamA family outer membrane protein [Shewanella youngdeokensis]|uniref:BamA/TamA family outer membrane protein n=1 Tax=Shewanella youngdeokensis TaxID=2999068 RepID=A0ABZ0K258_9GAMM|nr:BamA/TamA family outer membrane protein [Shewanella sp. DAU334]